MCVSKAATVAPKSRTPKEVDMNPNKKLMVVVATFMWISKKNLRNWARRRALVQNKAGSGQNESRLRSGSRGLRNAFRVREVALSLNEAYKEKTNSSALLR
jgi:hypothetical protein